jgi:hypothetical protein
MRQLIIGADVAAATATGIIIYKKTAATGAPALLLKTDTLITAPELKICRNGSICSPWIPGADIVKYTGAAGIAQTANSVSIAFSTGTTAGKTVTVKVIDQATGSEPYVRESFEFTSSTVANTNGANARTAAAAHIAATGYKGMIASVSGSNANCVLTTHTYAGPSATGYNKQSNIVIAFDNDSDATLTATPTYTAATSNLGDSFLFADFEKSLLGSGKGDYYRVQQPDATTTYAVAGTRMDIYNITWKSRHKDGQINKVDNMHELYVAVPNGASTWPSAGGTGFEDVMGGYLASTLGAGPLVTLS